MPHSLKLWIADAARSRAIDERAEAEYGLPPRVLMERAGMAVFDAVRDMRPDGGHVVILCGKGKNGGDGFVVARLARENGYQVEALVAASRTDLCSEALEQYHLAAAQNVRCVFADEPCYDRHLEALAQADLIVDALLGTGIRGIVRGEIRDAIQAINRSGVPVLAVDIPSGIDTDTGEELGESVWAQRTICLGLPKPYLFQGIGLEHAGAWDISPIGLPKDILQEPTGARIIDEAWAGALLPERMRASHKRENGAVLIVAGSLGMRGAAVLCARAAIRAGAGLVTVASVGKVCDAVMAHLPEAMVVPLPENDEGAIDVAAENRALEVAERADAVVVGPGLSGASHPFLKEFLANLRKNATLDAEALNFLAGTEDFPIPESVLTPHSGEMSRLLQSSTAEVAIDRFATIARATERYGETVLLKGPYSLIHAPSHPILVNPTGNSGLATGGTGDSLSGIIGTLLAQELPPYYAAACAAFWHGLAADLCQERIGARGYFASEVADALPFAFQRLAERRAA